MGRAHPPPPPPALGTPPPSAVPPIPPQLPPFQVLTDSWGSSCREHGGPKGRHQNTTRGSSLQFKREQRIDGTQRQPNAVESAAEGLLCAPTEHQSNRHGCQLPVKRRRLPPTDWGVGRIRTGCSPPPPPPWKPGTADASPPNHRRLMASRRLFAVVSGCSAMKWQSLDALRLCPALSLSGPSGPFQGIGASRGLQSPLLLGKVGRVRRAGSQRWCRWGGSMPVVGGSKPTRPTGRRLQRGPCPLVAGWAKTDRGPRSKWDPGLDLRAKRARPRSGGP